MKFIGTGLIRRLDHNAWSFLHGTSGNRVVRWLFRLATDSVTWAFWPIDSKYPSITPP